LQKKCFIRNLFNRHSMKRFFVGLYLVIVPGFQSSAQDGLKNKITKDNAFEALEGKLDHYKQAAFEIWNYAELGYHEQRSSALLQGLLSDNGFTVEAGVAGLPTSFVATYGEGEPVIGILAEFDALPGFSQTSAPRKESIPEKTTGHACGHHLFGVGSVAAAVELKELIARKALSGTVKVIGTPAEEGGAGKVYMTREGIFDDVDVVLHWHPGNYNAVIGSSTWANISAKFRFYGTSAHAAGAPDRGRSSLDAVESMNYMVNMMREHIPSDNLIHYIISNGGEAPNVVPDFAESYYYARSPDKDDVLPLFERIVAAAKGAGMGTGTKMEYEVLGGSYNILINSSLAEIMQSNLEMVGGVTYTPTEKEFALELQKTFSFQPPSVESVEQVLPLSEENGIAGSTDVGDVSWFVPTVGLMAATWVAGTPGHSWQAVACGGTDIGIKGMYVAAKTMLGTAIDLMSEASYIQEANKEHQLNTGESFKYKSFVGDRLPPLDYRKSSSGNGSN
jgi:aminobenzoyl-glutamate utilization protein B